MSDQNDKLKTWPAEIWLQHGADELPGYDEVRGDELTWCADNINTNDVRYVRATPAPQAAPSEQDVRNFVLHEAIQECRALIAHVDKRRPDSGEWEAYNNGIEECIEAMDNMLRATTSQNTMEGN